MLLPHPFGNFKWRDKTSRKCIFKLYEFPIEKSRAISILNLLSETLKRREAYIMSNPLQCTANLCGGKPTPRSCCQRQNLFDLFLPHDAEPLFRHQPANLLKIHRNKYWVLTVVLKFLLQLYYIQNNTVSQRQICSSTSSFSPIITCIVVCSTLIVENLRLVFMTPTETASKSWQISVISVRKS